MTEPAVRYQTCNSCGEQKSVEEFYRHPSGTPKRECSTCENKRNAKYRKGNAKRLAYKRARQRAVAIVAGHHKQEVDELITRLLPECLEQVEAIGGPLTLLKPGRKKTFEDVEDRIADPKCEDCDKAHSHGHQCGTCGSSPEHQVRVVHLSEEGQLRLSRTETTVLKP